MTRPVVAVTGATGFIGRRLVQLLADSGYAVRAFARKPQAQAGPKSGAVDWITGTLEDRNALDALAEGAEAIVHCAGAIKAYSRDAFLEVNAGGTRRLAEAAASRANPPRLIHLSSIAAREPLLSSYAASKRAGEVALKPFAEKLRPVILRPPAVYGPGDGETLRIFSMAERGLFPVPWGRAGRISMVHVDDVGRAVLAALKMAPPAGIVIHEFDDASGGYTLAEIAQAAGRALGTSPRLVPVPVPALYGIGVLGSIVARVTGRPTLINWGKVSEILHPDWVAAGPPIAGYNPGWDINKGFENAVNWYRSRGMLKSNG
jgi:nucleoside-diphosphate-sugar epimerase